MQSRHRWLSGLMWGFFGLWLLAQLPGFIAQSRQGRSPIDFLAYDLAAQAIQRDQSPYQPPEETQKIWRAFHQDEQDVIAASAQGQGAQVLREQQARPQQPGPYVYPPSLALLIMQLHIDGPVFAVLLGLAIAGFAWLWLRETKSRAVALLLLIFSLEVLTSLQGGNVELLLLFATLLGAWLLWHQRGILAAPLIALVVVIKPFYALFFVAFGLFQLRGQAIPARRSLRTLATAAGVALLLVMLEIVRWGAELRAETLFYLRHALDYQWFVLPVAQQTPMSIWNRTPMQALMSAGLSAPAAQLLSLALWAIGVGVTLWASRSQRLDFPLAFALAFVLLYWGRPVGWGLIYLEFVVALVLWPSLQPRRRWLLLLVVIALMASRWWALILTARGYGMPLMTLQSAALPWETWIVLPGSWLLLLGSIVRSASAVAHAQAAAG
ncbi:MAG TPA: glycosyltransferase family 87 protein [Herpetosiphonaceae bacterium]